MHRPLALCAVVVVALQLIAALQPALAQPRPPGPPSVPEPKPPQVRPPDPPKAESFFGSLRKRVIADANALDGWRRDAESALGKAAGDFAGCPSRDAQSLYDSLGQARQKAAAARTAAETADRDGTQARQRCIDTPGMLAPTCVAAYNNLPFAAQRASAQAAAEALDAARQALKALRCPAGCDKPLTLRVTDAKTRQGDPVSPEQTVCTAWDPGRLLLRAGIEGDELGAEFKARLPRCSAHQTVVPRYCKSWDAGKLLPALKSLKLVPPEFDAGRLSITVPTVAVPVLTGLSNQCRRTASVCTQVKGQATIVVDAADVFGTLAQITGVRCGKRVAVGCSDPPLGLQPTMGKVAVPVAANAKLTWTSSDGSSRVEASIPEQGFTWVQTYPVAIPVPVPQVKASGSAPRLVKRSGSLEFDFTRPELGGACRAWADVSVPTVRVAYTQRTVAAPLCISPRLGPLVARP